MSASLEQARVPIWLAPLRGLERARGWRRLALALIYLMILAAIGLVACRHLGLVGLPDPGEPFPAPTTGREQGGAAPLFEQAAEAVRPYRGPLVQGTISWEGGRLFQETPINRRLFDAGWAATDPMLRAWVESNRMTLDLWRRGAEQADPGRRRVDEQPGLRNRLIGNVFYSVLMASRLEASRHEQAGDAPAAWAWHRAALRTLRHVGAIDPFSVGAIASLYQPMIRRDIARWAALPGVDAALVRRALDDVRAIESIPDRPRDALNAEYRNLLRSLDGDDEWLERQARVDAFGPIAARLVGVGNPTVGLSWLAEPIFQVRRFALHEPERSRRVARLVYSNWVRHADALIEGRAGFTRLGARDGRFVLRDAPADPPSVVAGLPAATLARWVDSTIYLRYRLPDLHEVDRGVTLRAAEQARLVVELAGALYARDHGGTPPPSAEALVGPYLDVLPDGYLPPAD